MHEWEKKELGRERGTWSPSIFRIHLHRQYMVGAISTLCFQFICSFLWFVYSVLCRVGKTDPGNSAGGTVVDEFWRSIHTDIVHRLLGVSCTSKDLLHGSLAAVCHLYVLHLYHLSYFSYSVTFDTRYCFCFCFLISGFLSCNHLFLDVLHSNIRLFKTVSVHLVYVLDWSLQSKLFIVSYHIPIMLYHYVSLID